METLALPLSKFLENAKKFWPRYIIIKEINQDGRLSQLSGIKISRKLDEILGEVENARKNRDGSLLLQLKNEQQWTEIQKINTLLGIPVEITPHRNLNSCKGVVFSMDSHEDTEDDLLDFFQYKKYPVIDVKRLGKPIKGKRETLVITFQGDHLPTTIKVGLERCKVKPFIPNPYRCFNCQKFGHLRKTCTRNTLCGKCGSPDHTSSRDQPCIEIAKCVNCDGDHASYDRKCPIWLKEKEVQKLCVIQKINRNQARRLVESSNGPVTYSSVAQTSHTKKPHHGSNNSINKNTKTHYTSSTETKTSVLSNSPTKVGNPPERTSHGSSPKSRPHQEVKTTPSSRTSQGSTPTSDFPTKVGNTSGRISHNSSPTFSPRQEVKTTPNRKGNGLSTTTTTPNISTQNKNTPVKRRITEEASASSAPSPKKKREKP